MENEKIIEKIKETLNRSLETALLGGIRDYCIMPNACFLGKTDIAKKVLIQWANENEINLVELDLAETDPNKVCRMLGYHDNQDKMDFVAALSKPNTVLYLHEYNRADRKLRYQVASLCKEGEIAAGKGRIPNLLYVVSTIIPWNNAKDPANLNMSERTMLGGRLDLLNNDD